MRRYYRFHGARFYAFTIPVNLSESQFEMTSFVMEAAAAYSYEKMRPLVYETVLKTQRARDPQSSKMVDVILDGIVLDFAAIYNIGDVDAMLEDAVFDGRSWNALQISAKGPIGKALTQINQAHF